MDAGKEKMSELKIEQTLLRESGKSKFPRGKSASPSTNINNSCDDKKDQLSDAHKFAEALIGIVSQPLLILDNDLYIKNANKSFYRTFGVEEHDICGRSLFSIYGRQWDDSGLRDHLGKTLPLEDGFDDHEIEIDSPTGRLTLMVCGRLIREHDETLVVLTMEDVTQRKQLTSEREFSNMLEKLVTERTHKLMESEAFLHSVLNSTHYGIASYEPIRDDNNKVTDFRITYTNNEVPGNFGMKPNDVIGKTCRQVYPGIFHNGVFEKLVNSIDTGIPEQYEILVEHNDNALWLTASVEKVNNSLTITSKNVTAEKTAELHLQEVNRLLNNKNRELEQQIFSDFSDSFSSFKTGKDFFDFLLQELSQKTKMDHIILGEILQDESGDYIKCIAVCGFGKVAEVFSFPLKDVPGFEKGRMKRFSIAAGAREAFPENTTFARLEAEGYIGHPLADSNGEIIGLLAVLHQTEIMQLTYVESLMKIAAKRCEIELDRLRNEKMLEETNAELLRNNKELESFNYIASHDLQEPLRKIQLFYSRILEQDQKNLSNESLNYFASINNAAGRMQNLIEALLSYSTANLNEVTFERTDINKVIKEVTSDLYELIEAKNATIEVDPLPKVSVIPVQFKQLLSNLISNGMKYSKKDEPPVIKISSEIIGEETRGSRYIAINIEDNGIGFDQKYEHKIFELFQRLHGKHDYNGTGIGLAICKKIAQNHKGMIKVRSEPGKGSVFSILLPLKN